MRFLRAILSRWVRGDGGTCFLGGARFVVSGCIVIGRPRVRFVELYDRRVLMVCPNCSEPHWYMPSAKVGSGSFPPECERAIQIEVDRLRSSSRK